MDMRMLDDTGEEICINSCIKDRVIMLCVT